MGTARGYSGDAAMQMRPVYVHEGPTGEPLPGTVPPAYTYDEQMRAFYNLEQQQQQRVLHERVGVVACAGSVLPESEERVDLPDGFYDEDGNRENSQYDFEDFSSLVLA